MKVRILMLLLLISPPCFAYPLQGEENTLAHGAVGFGITSLGYGFIKRLVFQNDKPTWDQKLFLLAMANVINIGAMVIKEASDDSSCRRSGNPQGCLDLGAAGYGVLGGVAASAAVLVFDF